MDDTVRRRSVIGAVGGLAVASLAGCLDDGADGAADDTGGAGADDSDSDEPEPEAIGSDELVYAFSPDQISILDPAAGDVVDEITDEFDDESWADPQITHDYGLLFVVEQSLNQVHVIDTETRTHETAIDVGPGSNHIFHPVDDEIWVHADDDGAFYVIDVDALEVSEIVEAGLEGEGHGKLLYHEAMGDTGYATNVNNPGIPVIDLEAYERTGFVEFGDGGSTHYKAYGPQNGLAYVEYRGRTTVVDTETDDVVDELDFTGGMFLSPEEDRLAIVDDEVYIVDVTSDSSDVLGSLAIDGDPSTVRFGPDGETAFVANAESGDVAVIDLAELEEVDRLEAGAFDGRNRMAVSGDEYFVTPADADESVAVVDMTAQEVQLIDVGAPVDTVQYVGNSGVGYTGRYR
ncbi:YncE family protein [Natrarchaeobius sp. A-rgal3]|uniref:YncE family protein n=1 Tax=Natrarchaeobius versutus TaxID=1679078 RepID=UPI00350FB325